MKRMSTALQTLAGVALAAATIYPATGQAPSAAAPASTGAAAPASTGAAAPTSTAPTVPLAFSIADVHALPHSKATYMNLSMVNHDRLVIHHATLVDLISLAYAPNNVNSYGMNMKILGGPSWLDNDRYEIAALAPRDTQFPDLRLMLRGLLADRFKLVVHTEDRPQPAYVLTAPKGAGKMKQSAGTDTSGCKSPPDTKPAPDTPVTFTCRGESMTDFVAFMQKFVQYSPIPPIVDATGLKGLWDFEIQLPTTQPRNSPENSALLKSVETIGLNIAPGTAPRPAMIVDSANEQPTPNPPGLEAAMPPLPPAEFEVATIKPTAPGSKPGYAYVPGQINFPGITMRRLLSIAWQMNDDQMIADPPKWLDEDKFDIVAKLAVPDAPAGSTGPPQIDYEQMPGLLRKLLEERFVITTHMEDHPVEAYALVADKPKMQKADPQGRSGCKEGPGPDGKDPRIAKPILGRLLSCQNVTMAQFAEYLPRSSNGYIKIPVFDATGLTGSYDFVLSFSGYSQVGGINGYTLPAPASGDPGAGGASADPTGGLLLFDALKQQLGLKLEKQKHLFPMLVLDHINQKPTEN